MKKLFLLLSILLSSVNVLFAQNFSDDFESYKAGDYLAQSNSKWTTWANKPGTSQDVQVSNANAHSGNNSIYFSSSLSAGGPVDEVLPFGSVINTGSFALEMLMYIDKSKPAYFNLQANSTPGQKWSMEIYMNSDSSFIITNTDGSLLSGTYPQGKWIDVKLAINFNTNTWELFINNTSKGTFANTVNQIASMDIYSYPNSSFYVDDVSFTSTPYTLQNTNGAAVNLTNTKGLEGQSVIPRAYIRNVGKNTITSCDISLLYNGNTISKSISGIALSSLDTYSVFLSPIQLASSSSNAVLTISNVNGAGKDNDTTDDSKTFIINPIIPAPGKLVIGEEFTGTWCGFCPRGTVFLDYMTKKYGKYFQGIAVHDNDPMALSGYDGVSSTFIKSYPTIMTNRMDTMDPSAVEVLFLNKITTAPFGTIVNGATYVKDSNLLKVSLTTTFATNLSGDYRIACVLTEDSVRGTGTGYDQHNYYSGGSLGPMGGFEKLANPVPAADMVYNHVSRIIAPNFYGLKNSFPSSIVSGTNYNLIFKFDVGAYNVNNLHIVGILFNPNGTINNGSSTTLSEAEANGFQSVGQVAGIEQMLMNPNIHIYPNPAADYLYISGLKGKEKIVITDISGKELLYFNTVSNDQTSVPISTLSNGFYLIKIISNDNVFSSKILIQK